MDSRRIRRSFLRFVVVLLIAGVAISGVVLTGFTLAVAEGESPGDPTPEPRGSGPSTSSAAYEIFPGEYLLADGLGSAVQERLPDVFDELGRATRFGVVYYEEHQRWAWINLGVMNGAYYNPDEINPIVVFFAANLDGVWNVAISSRAGEYEALLNALAEADLAANDAALLQDYFQLHQPSPVSALAGQLLFPWANTQNPWQIGSRGIHNSGFSGFGEEAGAKALDFIPQISASQTARVLAMDTGYVIAKYQCTWNTLLLVRQDGYPDSKRFVYMHIQNGTSPVGQGTTISQRGQYLGDLRNPVMNAYCSEFGSNCEMDYNPATGNLCSKSTTRHLHLGVGTDTSIAIDGQSVSAMGSGQMKYSTNHEPTSCDATSLPSGYTQCAAEGGTCSFSGTQNIYYGANNCYRVRSYTSSVGCSNDNFPPDPAFGFTKACFRPPNSPQWAYRLFSLGDLNGDKYEAGTGTVSNLSSVGWNDRAQSMEINSDIEVIVCVDADFHGECGRRSGYLAARDIREISSALRNSQDQGLASSVMACSGSCPAGPSAPSLDSPADGGTVQSANDVILQWHGGGSQYRVEVTGGNGYSNSRDWQTSTGWNLGKLVASSNAYTWRVKSYNGYGESGWVTRTFHVVDSGPVFSTGVWIADGSWKGKTTFNPNEPIQWVINVTNSTGGGLPAVLKYQVTDPLGRMIVNSVGTYTIDPGGWVWGLPGTTTDVGGTYSFAGSVIYGGNTTTFSTTYVVAGLTYLPGSKTFRSTGSLDGWTLESSETGGTGGSMNAVDGSLAVGDDASRRQFRSILSFNTSGLPDKAIITSVTLRLKRQGVVGANPFGSLGNLVVDIRKGSFSGSAALQVGDFQAPASQRAALTLTNSPLSGWYSKGLGASSFAYINPKGTTQFRLRFATGDNNNAAADYMKFYSGNFGTSSYRPQLFITYYAP